MTTFDDLKTRYPDQFPATAAVECGHGWAGIVGRLLAEIEPMAEATRFRIVAVRQKLGALRLDTVHDGDDRLRNPLLLAEFRSRVTCEECGKAGHVRSLDGWKRCRCDEHCQTAEERAQPPRPAWTIGRLTTEGYLWYDPEADAVRIVEADELASIGVPPDHAEQIASARQEAKRAAAVFKSKA